MLLTLFFVALFVLLAMLTIFRNVIYSLLSAFFSLFHRNRTRNSSATTEQSPKHTVHRGEVKRSKVIDKSDGEYVDFEEVSKE